MRRFGERPRLGAAVKAGGITRPWALTVADWTRKLPGQMCEETGRILLDAAATGASTDDLATIAAYVTRSGASSSLTPVTWTAASTTVTFRPARPAAARR
jgi:hypothetical protein